MGERPRSVGPARAAALLYGDWGTSKAYVLGIAFALAGYASFPILVAMALLTALVGLNYYWICSHYPDGGGVYSSVRDRSRLFATVGALLLIADYLVTASLSVLEGFNYLSHLCELLFHVHLSSLHLMAVGLLVSLGVINWWGPRHSGSVAVVLAIPASLAAASIAVLAFPHLGEATFEHSKMTPSGNWMLFASIVLALSGVEAVSNMTGVMVADPKKDPKAPDTVKRTSALAIGLVATEVVVLTVILAWAMHATPGLQAEKSDAMLGQMAQHFGSLQFGERGGEIYSAVVGVVMALLLFSAGNTAIVGMISVFYLMASDKEMPAPFGKLNRHGVPTLPLVVATALPCILLLFVHNVAGLASLYAIGVVGAITLNIGACSTNRHLKLSKPVRLAMGATAIVMLCIWITIAVDKHDALIFAVTILALGLLARSFVQERRQVMDEEQLKAILEQAEGTSAPSKSGTRILVALRGVTDSLVFAIDEARIRNGRLGVVFVREVNVLIPVPPKMNEDPEALKIFQVAKILAEGVPLEFIYKTSDNTPKAILSAAKEFKADYLVMGASSEGALAGLLRGSIITFITENLPQRTKLLIYSWKPDVKKPAGEASGLFRNRKH